MLVFENPPEVGGGDTAMNLRNIRSYLYQMAEKLNEALRQVESSQKLETTAREKLAQQAAVTASEAAKKVEQDAKKRLIAEAKALKDLIIANADEIEHAEERIEKTLSENYVARSEFGTFKETNKQEMLATAQGEFNNFINSQEWSDITGALEQLNGFRSDTEAYIHSGLLFYDEGLPVYGVGIGYKLQQIVDQEGNVLVDKGGLAVTITPEKIAFYQSGVEVAYLSNHKLYVADTQVLSEMRIGPLLARVDDDGVGLYWDA